MKLNVAKKADPIFTHEGGKADKITPLQELRRTLMTCLLWEDTFYESGSSIASRMAELVKKVKPEDVAALAIIARNDMYLRHAPLFLVRELARIKGNGSLVADTLHQIIQRPDELTEYVAIYWKDKKQPLSAGSKRGLAAAFQKFNEYQLAKWNKDGAIKLRDVLFLCHAKPNDEAQADLWKRLIDGDLETPETWEVMLSAGKDKKATFEYLIQSGKLGGMAFLRNLRNMRDAGVSKSVAASRLDGGFDKILPFRFVTAARIVPQWQDIIENAMLKSLDGVKKLSGHTGILVDVSGSMGDPISEKSETTRIDAASGLAILIREISSTCSIGGYDTRFYPVQPVRGFAIAEAFRRMSHGGTDTSHILNQLRSNDEWFKLDRLIVITDEQHSDGRIPQAWAKNSYIINVGSYKNGTGYSNGWNHIDGWSDRIIDYIVELEGQK